ncbi:YjbH domain-containing protein [Shewanella sp. SG44-2]|uniref:YjbH domain-containing protein n=1 Tax=Shewanella sp. SG44-2 TaxID=2760962 RepID=UPI0016017D92|nr:YjbH domain-containing protein [Shewanella sp. SG44-2]MBB1425226.1 YjbH domain-containing protein [Shewanella sp. SG44-2]
MSNVKQNVSYLFAIPFMFSSVLVSEKALSDELSKQKVTPSQYDFGGVGLIQMPTGRMAAEGEFSVNATFNEDYYHGALSIQLFPWLETTIRYTQVPDVLYSNDPEFSGDTYYTDKGIDVKLRLLEESYWIPETSIGVRDIGGTGLFDSEYIAMTKAFGPFDATIGMGWGYIGNRGNLTDANKSSSVDCNRNTGYKGKGGNVDFERWFKGCSAVFAGIEYQTPWDPLRIKVEYDGNDYKSDFAALRTGNELKQSSPINYGLLYKVSNWGDFKLSYERGNTWTLGFSLATNFNTLKSNWRDTPKQAIEDKSDKTDRKVDLPELNKQLAYDAGYKGAKIYIKNDEVTVVATQTKYRDRKFAHDQAGRILSNQFPNVSTFKIIENTAHLPTTETHIDTKQFKDAVQHNYLNAKIEDSTKVIEPTLPTEKPDWEVSDQWSYGFAPKLAQSFGGSENFYLFNVGINGSAGRWLTDNLEISGAMYINLFDNYDQFKYKTPPDGTDLKRVRTLVRQYVSDNPVRIDNLQLTWLDKLSENIYAQAYVGYLEMMFGGVGAEVLYRPMNSEWAFGVDANYVKQRDPDNLVGFFDQELNFDPDSGRYFRAQTGTFTGHASVYYQPSWFDDVLLKVSYGQYLAEDRGVTVDFSKQFDSGVIVGAFASKTNLSADQFGEGSFTKGFYISIPFDAILPTPVTNRGNLAWQPLTRDGGQKLGRKFELYGGTDARAPWLNKPSTTK